MMKGILWGTFVTVVLVLTGTHPLLAFLAGATSGVYAAVASEHRRW